MLLVNKGQREQLVLRGSKEKEVLKEMMESKVQLGQLVQLVLEA